eukprot:3893188-Prymnesium_polylepis.2
MRHRKGRNKLMPSPRNGRLVARRLRSLEADSLRLVCMCRSWQKSEEPSVFGFCGLFRWTGAAGHVAGQASGHSD